MATFKIVCYNPQYQQYVKMYYEYLEHKVK